MFRFKFIDKLAETARTIDIPDDLKNLFEEFNRQQAPDNLINISQWQKKFDEAKGYKEIKAQLNTIIKNIAQNKEGALEELLAAQKNPFLTFDHRPGLNSLAEDPYLEINSYYENRYIIEALNLLSLMSGEPVAKVIAFDQLHRRAENGNTRAKQFLELALAELDFTELCTLLKAEAQYERHFNFFKFPVVKNLIRSGEQLAEVIKIGGTAHDYIFLRKDPGIKYTLLSESACHILFPPLRNLILEYSVEEDKPVDGLWIASRLKS